MIVPKIALITTTISEQIRVSSSEETARGEVTASQKPLNPSSNDLLTDRRQRQQDDQAQVEHDRPPAETGTDPRQAHACLGSGCRRACCVSLHR